MSKYAPNTLLEKLAYMWREFWAAFSLALCACACACVPSTSLAAGSATASDVALKGGMSIIDGTFITAIFMGLSSVITAIGFLLWGHKKEQKLRTEIADKLRATIINDPLHIQNQGPFVTVGECKQHRCAIDRRIDAITPMLKQISEAVERSASRAEERAVQLHRRLDPIVEKLAATSAEVEMMKGKR